MAIPPVIVAACFFVAAIVALGLMAYIAWRGAKPSDFFQDAVAARYDLELPEQEINNYYDLKDRMRQQAEEAGATPADVEDDSAADSGAVARPEPWVRNLTQQQRLVLQNALLQRLVSGIDKLDQVQRDKPGNFKLWRGKLVSEQFWNSLLDAEKLIGEEIDSCLVEADEIAPGSREHIFPHAVHVWRSQKQQLTEKKAAKKAVELVKKQPAKDLRNKEVEEKKAAEEKLRAERQAEKAMEKLLREEEHASKAKPSKGASSVPKSGPKKKK